MVKSERGSVTLIVLATILFIFAVLATNLIFVSAKRKSQLQETMLLQDAYDTGMSASYYDQIEKLNTLTQAFEYTGVVQTFTITKSGKYLLEVYGAQGGNVSYNSTTHTGGKGGYSKGIIKLEKGDILYIHIGSKGTDETVNDTNSTVETVSAGSGKASYISKTQNATLTSNSTDILIVANGGGGATNSENGTANSGEKFGSNNTGYAGNLENSEIKSGERSGNGFARISYSD